MSRSHRNVIDLRARVYQLLSSIPTATAMHFDLQEEVQALQDGTYAIEHELAVKNARPGQVDMALDGELCARTGCRAILTTKHLPGAIDAIAGSSESVTNDQVFDTFRSLLKWVTALHEKLSPTVRC